MQPPPLKTNFFEMPKLIARAWQAWFNLVGQSGYVDRGDPAAYDFTLNDFTTDETWRELDLSGIVPAGASLVHLKVRILDGAADSLFRLRRKGNSNTISALVLITQVVDISMFGEGFIKPDKNNVIEYYGTDLAFTNIDILVKGWFI